jgi:nucleoside-diphosphate-sugar epimerase
VRVVLTGSSGRIGRAIFAALVRAGHDVTGVDVAPFSTTRIVGDCADGALMARLCEGADAVIHTAGPHAPHVGLTEEAGFERVNVGATAMLYETARAAGCSRFLYTSTTALYGEAVREGGCTWIDEDTPPQPRTVYHRTKLAAETLLAERARPDCPVRVLRMSRCFPEPAPAMAAYRLHRGIDARDVAAGHLAALAHKGAPFERFILSGDTPFGPEDCGALAGDTPAVLRERVPALAAAFAARGWALPQRIDRVYAARRAAGALGWRTRFGWEEVIAQFDRASLEVLPPGAITDGRQE